MPPRRGSSSLKQSTGFLTPEAQKRRELEEAQNFDKTGAKKVPGQVIRDRDGKCWCIQSVHKIPVKENYRDGMYGAIKTVGTRVYYDVTPVPLAIYEGAYVRRRVTDEQIDNQDFGFQEGSRLSMVDGKLVRTPSKYT